jgi:hypothetical protein
VFIINASIYNNRRVYLHDTHKRIGAGERKPEDKAKFYFELAGSNSWETDACTSYQNALYGPFGSNKINGQFECKAWWHTTNELVKAPLMAGFCMNDPE